MKEKRRKKKKEEERTYLLLELVIVLEHGVDGLEHTGEVGGVKPPLCLRIKQLKIDCSAT